MSERAQRISDELFVKHLDPSQVEADGESYIKLLRAICDHIAAVSLEG